MLEFPNYFTVTFSFENKIGTHYCAVNPYRRLLQKLEICSVGQEIVKIASSIRYDPGIRLVKHRFALSFFHDELRFVIVYYPIGHPSMGRGRILIRVNLWRGTLRHELGDEEE